MILLFQLKKKLHKISPNRGVPPIDVGAREHVNFENVMNISSPGTEMCWPFIKPPWISDAGSSIREILKTTEIRVCILYMECSRIRDEAKINKCYAKTLLTPHSIRSMSGNRWISLTGILSFGLRWGSHDVILNSRPILIWKAPTKGRMNKENKLGILWW